MTISSGNIAAVDDTYMDGVRVSYDTVAADYAKLVVSGGPSEVPLLTYFGSLVGAGGEVLDVGCGPGRVTALLRSLGLSAFGIDLSPGMVEVARRDFPGVRFEVGSMTALDLPDDKLGGIVSWWSTVHLPADELATAFAEFHRVLRPGGQLLVGFHVGTGSTHKTSGYGGHPMSLDVYRRTPDELSAVGTAAGFTVHSSFVTALDSERQGACLFFAKPDNSVAES
ncbi:methyltransferase family protein [Kribbella voronezhensis]|uniref:Methyltransferase family protein n=1 Tax=Kribbella voronezhensis TaxID=2512212 RepID=A0A4V3FKG2_9ACTN|nr:class I SAM-dependent methyltransferase [Kribbella voronezhensis]TDU90063.1 methyltransferase family protein [Kribbella voronezhensis]